MFGPIRQAVIVGILHLIVTPGGAAHGAESYPSKPLRVVIGSSPGGSIDLTMRPVAHKLTELVGQQVLIDYRPGANGNIAAAIVAKAPSDGYTLLMASLSNLTINPAIYERMPFDTLKDFAPITQIGSSPLALVVHPSVPTNSIRELIGLARSQPNKLSFSSAGIGSANHLAAELFKLLTKTTMTHVAYRGGGPATVAVVGGEVETVFITVPSMLPFFRNGRLKALATLASKRSPALPEIPTAQEAGLAGLEVSAGTGLLAPAGTTREVIARLHAETVKVLALPDVQEKLSGEGRDLIADTPQQYSAFLREEITKWATVVKKAAVKLE
ncbi:MAG: tripartite tricarboxylate transporter substrate binding protein [Burkholderiales bacterium]|nr:tripartite tricarboxylate transporter substrate binding protein [Burkholderiales bacterium]